MLRVAVCAKSDTTDVSNLLRNPGCGNVVIRRLQPDSDILSSPKLIESFDYYLIDNASLRELLSTKTNCGNRVFLVHTRENKRMIPYSSIILVTSFNRALTVYVEESEPIISKPLRININNLLSPLLSDDSFVQARNGCVLNMAKVRSVQNYCVTMSNGQEIRIPRNFVINVREKYMTYIKTCGNGTTERDGVP